MERGRFSVHAPGREIQGHRRQLEIGRARPQTEIDEETAYVLRLLTLFLLTSLFCREKARS